MLCILYNLCVNCDKNFKNVKIFYGIYWNLKFKCNYLITQIWYLKYTYSDKN